MSRVRTVSELEHFVESAASAEERDHGPSPFRGLLRFARSAPLDKGHGDTTIFEVTSDIQPTPIDSSFKTTEEYIGPRIAG